MIVCIMYRDIDIVIGVKISISQSLQASEKEEYYRDDCLVMSMIFRRHF